MVLSRDRVMFWCALALVLALGACGDDSDNGADVGDGNNEVNNDTNNNDANNDANNDGNNDTNNDDNNDDNNDANNDNSDELPPMPWSPLEEGFYGIGYSVDSTTYTSPADGSERTLRLVYWYPTLDKEGEDAVYGGLLPRPGVFEDASVAIDEAAPVLIFSHGNSSFAEQSAFMTEFFASHGWIVVSMDHTGNTFRDGLEIGIFQQRPEDISAVIDHIEGLGAEHPLGGLISDNKILSGHSLGGYTTLAASGSGYDLEAINGACEAGLLDNFFCDYFTQEEIQAVYTNGFADERIKAAIPQAPFGGGIFGPGLADIDIPVLLITALLDVTLPPAQDGDPIWNNLDGADDIRVDFQTGGHFTFSNGCDLGIGDGDGCGDEFIEPEQAFFLVNAYSMIFARYHLFGDEEHLDILTGETELDSTLLISTK